MNGKACSSDDFECMKGCLLLYGTESNWMIPFQDSNSELLCCINTKQGDFYYKIFSQKKYFVFVSMPRLAQHLLTME